MPEGFTLQQISGDKVQYGVLTAYNKKNTIDLELLKVDVNNTAKKLNGAEFTLTPLDISQPGVHYPAGVDGTKKVTAGSGANAGKLTFDNLGSGYYEIRESKVPNGYVISGESTFYIKIDEEGIFMIMKDDSKTADHWEVISKYNTTTFDAEKAQVTVANEPGAALPHTGGMGTALIYILGIMLTAFAGAGLVLRKN